MATDKTFVQQCKDAWQQHDAAAADFFAEDGPVRTRPMMGEYCLYYMDKTVGGFYDNRLLLKDTPTSRELLPAAPRICPYPGAKAMLWLEDTRNASLVQRLLVGIAADIPAKKPRPRTPKK